MATIKVKFYGVTQDVVKQPQIELSDFSTLGEVIEYIYQTYPLLCKYKLKIAFRRQLMDMSESALQQRVVQGDEIAFLPPFSGG